jgi:glycosyltransferase involved in cell wall biosynthesis
MSQGRLAIDEFKPSYVWPNPAFPFRVYLNHPKCRIFIIENVGHNWMWMKEYSQYFRETDFFFVYCGWYFSEHFAIECEKIFKLLQLRKENFFFLFNSPRELLNFESYGFAGEVINHNAWLNEGSFFNYRSVPKVYDAIYVARLVQFKRHHLASAIPKLALVAGDSYSSAEAKPPPHVYINDKTLLPEEVSNMINASHCGLILSASEGACFSSSEYLLCGIPVVSTTSTGGRDVWYNEYNSIICEDTPDSVAAAVEKLKVTPRNPERIRMMHIDQQNLYRRVFIRILDSVFKRFHVELNASQFFKENYIHKLRGSMKPLFDDLFPRSPIPNTLNNESEMKNQDDSTVMDGNN